MTRHGNSDAPHLLAGGNMRLASTTYAIALMVPVLSGAQPAPPVSAGPSVLDPYVSCQYSGGLSVVSTIRLPGQGLRYRTVDTPNGEKKVSVIDGFRLMLGQGEPSYFANLKVEKSDPSQYARDKDAVIKSLEFLMQRSANPRALWDHMPYNGFDVYSLTDPTMEGNGPNGIYLLFRDSTQTIVTIYFLGQKPEYRKFKTIEEHDALTDRMLEELTKCANGQQQPRVAGNLPSLRTADDFGAFINTYYLHPRPDRIAEAIGVLRPSGVLEIAETVGPITAFFSEVFAANPTRLAEWQPIIDQQIPGIKSVLDTAVSWSKTGGVLKREGRSPQMNDLYWGAFFASGNPAYVKKLLELVPLADERYPYPVWATGASAKWSLASNARQHTLVISILEEEKRTADTDTQAIITELLTRDPARMRVEMAVTVARQKAAGKWR